MQVLIVGSGEVGLHLANVLSGEGHDVTVIERDKARSAAAQNALDALVVTGNGASPHLLREQGAGDADLLLAVTDVDEINVLAAAAGHRLGARRTLVRIRDIDELTGEDATFFREAFGVDGLIDPERATADDLAETLLVTGAAHVEYFAEGRLALAEVVLRQGSPLAGRIVADRERRPPHSIVGIMRHGQVMIPAATQRLEAGDHVFLAAARRDVGAVIARLHPEAERVGDAVVFGGGKIGLHLARRLEAADIEVKVFERDPQRARLCAERLPESLVIQEEGLSKETLVSHGVDRASAFVSCAGDDRTNVLATLHAKQLGVPLCLAVVTSEQLVPLVDALGVDGAFSLRLTTAEAILRFMRTEAVRAVHLTLSGAEVLDLHADPGSAIVGAEADGRGPFAGCEVGAILRDGNVVIPDGEERVEAGDRVLVFRLQGAAPDIERAFDA